MNLKLVSYALCPFVQQVAITLELKEMDFEVEYIDLSKPPAWFLEASPLKKVPILVVDGDHVLFESLAIIEFIEDLGERKTLPQDLFERCHERAWMHVINQMMWSLYDLSVNKSADEYDKTVASLHTKLDGLEAASKGGSYLFTDSLSLVDATIAPLLMRLNYIDEIAPGLVDTARHSKISKVNDTLMADARVRRSTIGELKQSYHALLGRRQGYLAALLSDEFTSLAGIPSRY